jgi:hypothetical protein
VRLPVGLLRSMRLAGDPSPWQDLEQAHWLFGLSGDSRPDAPVQCVQLLDPVVLAWAYHRPDRLQAADWSLRLYCARCFGCLGSGERLAALVLAAQTPAGSSHGLTRSVQLSRTCGLPHSDLPRVLGLLTSAGFLASWALAAHAGELTWTLLRPGGTP